MSNPNLHTEKSQLTPAEKEFENNIRPTHIAEFSGQQQIIENLKIFIKAAKMRRRPWIMFYFMVRRVWEKQLYQELLRMNWE